MNDVLERPPLSVSHYGEDGRPKLPRNGAALLRHRPVGRGFAAGDIEAWNPRGTLGSGMEFINRLHELPVLNSFSLDFGLLALGWPSPAVPQQSPILFPGTVFESRAGFPYIHTAYFAREWNRFRSGVRLVSELTGHELVARLKPAG